MKRKKPSREQHRVHATRSRDINAGYIYLAGKIKRGGSARTVVVPRMNINLDFAADGRLIGVELLDLKLMPWNRLACADRKR